MSTRRTGEVEQIRVFAIDGNSAPLTGLVDLYIRLERNSDGFLYDWADATWKGAGWTTLNQSIAEVDATNLPGLYELVGGFDPTAATNEAANDTYTVYALQTPGVNARLPGPGTFRVGYWVDAIFSELPVTIPDQVWEETLGSHSGTAGSTAEALEDASQQTTPAAVAAAVWNEILPGGHDTANSAGWFTQKLDAAVSSRAAPGDEMDLVTGAVDSNAVDATGANEIRDAILSDSTPFQGARIDAAISSRAQPGDAMDLTTNALDASSLDPTAIAEIADGVLDEALAGHTTAGTVGQALGRLDATISSRAVAGDAMDLVANAVDAAAIAADGAVEIAAAVWTALTATYAGVGTMGEAQGRLDAAVSSRATPGAAMTLTPGERTALETEIWDAQTSLHQVAGSTGKALTDASATTSPATIAAAVWDAATSSHTLAGSMGLTQGRLDQPISSRAAPGDLMGLQTDALTATALATSAVNEIRDSILSDSTPFQGSRIDAAVSSRSAPGDAMDLITDALDAGSLASSAVDEIVDQVWRETLTDHSGVVGSTAEALSNASSSVSPTTIAAAVWDRLLSLHTIVGSAGEAMARVDVAVSTRAAPGAAMDLVGNAVDASALAADAVAEIQAAILSDATPFAGSDIDAAVSSRSAPGDDMGLTAAAIDDIFDEPLAAHSTLGTAGKALLNVDAQVSTRAAPGDDMGLTSAGANLAADRIWDEALSGHLGTGSAGRKLSDLTVPPTAADIADQVWDESLGAHTVVGSAGEAQARLDAAITTRAAPGDDMGVTDAGANNVSEKTWRDTLADHSGFAGSTAEALAQTSPAAIGSSVWDALLASHNTPATFGGAINNCCATAAGASQVVINIQDLASAAVQGAQVDIFDATNTTFLSRHFTDVAGQVTIAIDDGTYAVRIWASGYAFTVPETLVVSGDGSATFQGQSFLSPSAPSGPDKCVIFGQVLDVGGSPVVGAEVDAYAVTPQVGGGYVIGPQVASTITNTMGYFELELLRNALVNFKIDDADVDVILTVPDAPSQWYTTWT